MANEILSGNQTATTAAITAAGRFGIFYSTGREVSKYKTFALEISWTGTGTLAGNFGLYGSNGGTNYDTLTYSPTVALSGTSGFVTINVTDFGYRYVDVGLPSVTGSGSLVFTVNFSGKN